MLSFTQNESKNMRIVDAVTDQTLPYQSLLAGTDNEIEGVELKKNWEGIFFSPCRYQVFVNFGSGRRNMSVG